MPCGMRINDDLAVLPLEADTLFGRSVLNLSLILDPNHGPTLVDTGIPGLLGSIQEALQAEGVALTSVQTVLITHHDLDHIGTLPEVVEATGAEVLASADEVPYIQDGRRGQKLPPLEAVPQILEGAPEAQRDAMRAVFTREPRRTPVAHTFADGEVLDFVGGVRVVFTPGHTAGHTSFFLERSRVLIAGDALSARDGQLAGPPERATPDLPTAYASVRKLAALNPAAIVCYHGGLVSEDAAGQLQRLAETLE